MTLISMMISLLKTNSVSRPKGDQQLIEALGDDDQALEQLEEHLNQAMRAQLPQRIRRKPRVLAVRRGDRWSLILHCDHISLFMDLNAGSFFVTLNWDPQRTQNFIG